MNLNVIANTLHNAQHNKDATAQISLSRNLTLEEAYAVQSILVSKRLIDGNSFRGVKMGFTSKEKMKQMGVHDLIWGLLTSDMEYQNNGEIDLSRFIHPRIEPEIAFKLAKDIDEDFNEGNMKSYVSNVCSALEIIDSRYKNFKFSLEDVVADNCSSAGYILGEWFPATTEIDLISMQLIKDGKVLQEGNSSSILGNPWNAFQESIRIARVYGHTHKAGDVILAGAATAAQFMESESTYEWQGDNLSSIIIHTK